MRKVLRGGGVMEGRTWKEKCVAFSGKGKEEQV